MFNRSTPSPSLASITCVALIALFANGYSFAQTAGDAHANHPDTPPTKIESGDLASELQALQLKVGQLEAALKAQHQARYATDGSMPSMSSSKDMGDKSMGGMKNMGGMRGMSQDARASSDSGGMSMGSGGMGSGGMGMGGMGMGGMGMGGMSMGGMSMGPGGTGSGGMGMMKGMMGMGMMGMGMMGMNPAMSSDSMAGMDMPSALPGFPGASHLYHVGQTGLFLDHPEHITLTDEQQKKLNELKESAVLATATAERKIEEAEQELWMLTAADQPDISKIEAKAKEIAQLQANKRIAFIRSVGEAANVLTNEQRQSLLGSVSSGGE